MSHTAVPPGFHPIRHDRLIQEFAHDAYQSKGKPAEPTVCPQCKAVFHEGRWNWMTPPAGAHQALCPACHRENDHFPAGFVHLEGPFFTSHRDEILNLLHNEERRERDAHPLKRIMAIEDQKNGVMVTTTDIHLARGIGEAVHHAYRGELEYHYNAEQNLLRVHWLRQ